KKERRLERPLDFDSELADQDGGQQRGRHGAEGKPFQFQGTDQVPERQGEKHHELGVGSQRRDEPGPGGIEHRGLERQNLSKASWIFLAEGVCARTSFRSTRDFAGLSSFDTTVPTLSSSTSMLRRTMPSPTRVDRTTTTPLAIARLTASSAGVVMFPSPTPAMTRPFAPLATAASMRSGDIPACA